MHAKLQTLWETLDEWCLRRKLPYSLVADEDDLQAFFFARAHSRWVNRLSNFLEPLMVQEGLYMKQEDVRGGVILAFSLQAIAEETMLDISRDYISPLAEKLDQVMDPTITELQMISPTGGHSGSQTTWQHALNPAASMTLGGLRYGIDNAGKPGRKRSKSAQRKTKTETPGGVLESRLAEALDGMAAEHQPQDLIDRLATAMGKFMIPMGREVVPLNKALAQGGYTAIKKRNGMSGYSLIFKKGGVAVKQISLEQLKDANGFDEVLSHLSDMALNRAPGATAQERDAAKEQDKMRSDIAKTHSPPDEKDAMAATESFQRRMARI